MLQFDRISQPLPHALASALRRLANLAHSSAWDRWAAQGLTPTQRRILEFLSVRRETMSLALLGQKLAITPATVADSLVTLEAQGLVRKRRGHLGESVVAVQLTSEGKRSVSAGTALSDPMQAAFEALSDAEQEAFYRMVIKMIRNLQQTGMMPITRMCVRCKYFDPFRYPDSATPHHCHLVGAPFADRHLRVDCPEQVFNESAAQEALWVRFNTGAGGQPTPQPAAPGAGAGGRASCHRSR